MLEAERLKYSTVGGQRALMPNLVPYQVTQTASNTVEDSTKTTEIFENRNSDFEVFKYNINQRFTQLENRITMIEEKLVELEIKGNSKLDSIIALLNK